MLFDMSSSGPTRYRALDEESTTAGDTVSNTTFDESCLLPDDVDGAVFDRILYRLDSLGMIKDQWLYKHPDSVFIHADMVFVAGRAARDSRSSRKTQSDHRLCRGGLQPHQSGERHQRRDIEFVGCTDLAP